MTRAVVSLNSGSSSIKFALFRLDEAGTPIHAAGGKIEGIGTAPRIVARADDGSIAWEQQWPDTGMTHEALLHELFDWAVGHLGDNKVVAIGHRVVHGGMTFAKPVRIDDALMEALEALCPLAPLHQPHNLAAIRAIAKLAPHLPQVACFDTAFHHDMPIVAARMALPRAMAERGYRRYGFHGLSYEYIARHLRMVDPNLAKGRVITAHLGNGASMCAMHDCRSIDSTMGFTALDGLMMGTRTGSLDPGVVVHLVEQEGMTGPEIEKLLYRQSGLLGVSGISSDMRELHASDDPHAKEAIELFAWRAARHAAALMTGLRGLDGLVFTAGIGENDPIIRAMICERLEWTGITLDPEANARNAPVISTADSRITVRVIPTDEEQMIALHSIATLNLAQGVPA
ncbi:MAG: acetate/propionate family kinase [Sphingomonadales bacterium]|nr:MAG: acetate/propionate family kinase [Sphingomonadales bacterium]TNF06268.1 MAG: acetate/propionate family kinase [Sphingomonadales bacterium]